MLLLRRFIGLGVPLLLVTCAHGDPFAGGKPVTDGPFGSGFPTRLTFNPGQDLEPRWLGGDTGLVYVYERPENADVDRCLGVLPPAGGTRRAEKCFTRDLAGLTTDALQSPAFGPGGQFAWVEAHSGVGARSPSTAGIRVGRFSVADTGRVVRPLP